MTRMRGPLVAGMLLLASPGVRAEPAAEPTGRRVFVERCAPCHGEDGNGDGPAAAALEPRPRNLRDPAFWQGRGTEQLRAIVRQGKPGTMMQPFADVLSDGEIDAVVAYLGRFRTATGAGAGDGQAPVAGKREDAARGPDRPGGGVPAVPGVHP